MRFLERWLVAHKLCITCEETSINRDGQVRKSPDWHYHSNYLKDVISLYAYSLYL